MSTRSVQLRTAVEGNEIDKVRRLLYDRRHVIDVNSRDRKGFTALICATVKGNVEMVRLLLEDRRIDVNLPCKSRTRATPLIHAVIRGSIEIVRLLLSIGGIDVNACSNRQCTPLDYTYFPGYRSREGMLEIVRLLEEYGGIRAINKRGGSCDMCAGGGVILSGTTTEPCPLCRTSTERRRCAKCGEDGFIIEEGPYRCPTCDGWPTPPYMSRAGFEQHPPRPPPRQSHPTPEEQAAAAAGARAEAASAGEKPRVSSTEQLQGRECVGCLEPATHVLVPCGHFCTCSECSTKLGKKCPICRAQIKSICKLY